VSNYNYTINEQNEKKWTQAISNYYKIIHKISAEKIKFIRNEKEFKGVFENNHITFAKEVRIFEIYKGKTLVKFMYQNDFLKKYLEI